MSIEWNINRARPRRGLIALALVAALGSAGCGSSKSSGGGSSSTPAAATGTAAGQTSANSGGSGGTAAAQAWLNKMMAPPKWNGPKSSPPIAKNKFVIDIPCSQAALGCSRQGNAFIDAAKTLGWKTQLIDPAGDPQKLQQAFQEAIQEHANGIFAPGGNAHTLGPWLQRAKQAGIKVVDLSGVQQTAGPGKLWDANILETNNLYARTDAAYIAVHSGGKAKVLSINDSEYAEINAQTQEFQHWLKVYCPGCQIVSNMNLSIVNVSTTFPQQVQATLKANPQINWVMTPYDYVTIYVVQAIDQAGLKGKVNVVGWGGHPQNLGFIKANNGEVATVAVGLEWAGYAAADQMNRMFDNKPLWGGPSSTENYGQELIDKSNLPSNTSAFWDGGVNYAAHYKAIWGVH